MQINNAVTSQTLNSNSADVRIRETQRLLTSVENVPAERQLESARAEANRDRVTLSPQAVEISRLLTAGNVEEVAEQSTQFVGLQSNQTAVSGSESEQAGTVALSAATGATPEEIERAVEQQELAVTRELAERDREVRAHEQTHAAIGGQYASAPSYTYERGPDGRLYAVAGEVKIDTSPIPNDPQATLEKAEIIQRAALSVAEPSPADRAVASEARVMAAEARAEILQQEQEERVETTEQTQEGNDEQSTSSERLQELREQQDERSENTAEIFEDFNDRLRDISKELADINQRLVDVGVSQSPFPEGSFLDQFV